ncbi:MAG: MFS transporter [Deltaproteobacteria bacterium]|jgi:MFS family permease|nr:MFS transporter [Deltaproteobacteria bacterium]
MRLTAIPYKYIIAAACFGIQAVGVGLFVTYGVFINPLIEEFGWTRAAISGASSLAFFLMGLVGIFVGRLNDKIGPRKVMLFTSFFIGLGFFLTSKIQSIWQLYLFYGLSVGIGLSSIDVIALSTTARWFVYKRGIVTGLVKVGTGAGQLIMPLTASLLIAGFGWRTSMVVIGIFGMILLVLISRLLHRDPEEMGFASREETIPKIDVKVLGGMDLSFGQAVRTHQFWIIFIVNFAVVYCLLITLVHIVPFARDLGVSATKAAGVISTIGGVSMFGRFATGIFIDRYNSRLAMIFCFVLLITTLLWLQVADELWMIYLFAACYGIAHGGFFTAISPIVAEYFGISAHGVLFGAIVFSGCFGGSVGPILAGHIFDVTGSYSPAFWLSTFIALLGLGFILFLKPIRK